MEDRLAVISCIISNPDSVATVNEKSDYCPSGRSLPGLRGLRHQRGSSRNPEPNQFLCRGPGKGRRCKGEIHSGAGQQIKEREGTPWNIWNGCCPW